MHVWSVVQLCLTLCDPMTVARQAPLSMGFSRQEYWSGLPCPPPGDLPDPGIEPASPVLAARFFATELPGKPSLTAKRETLKKARVALVPPRVPPPVDSAYARSLSLPCL